MSSPSPFPAPAPDAGPPAPDAARRAGGPDRCRHGGAFFTAIGDDFADLSRRAAVVPADVLDAWFPPAPAVVETLREHLPWLLRTSPPTHAEGLVRVVARERGVPEACVLAAGGSSELIYLALPRWVRAGGTAMVLDPTYGEYAHLLDRGLRARVARFPLARAAGYRPDPEALAAAVRASRPDLLVVVNPNSPTGVHLAREDLLHVLDALPATSRAWIDETYVEYARPGATLEAHAARRGNVVVCKSMSKAYALSGVRVAYAVGSPDLLDPLRVHAPPWSVGLLAQVAAVRALEATAYYAARWAETRALRTALAEALERLGLDVVEGVANFVLAHLPAHGPDAATVVARCAEAGVHLRDCGDLGTVLGTHSVRIAVRPPEEAERVVAALRRALAPGR